MCGSSRQLGDHGILEWFSWKGLHSSSSSTPCTFQEPRLLQPGFGHFQEWSSVLIKQTLYQKALIIEKENQKLGFFSLQDSVPALPLMP